MSKIDHSHSYIFIRKSYLFYSNTQITVSFPVTGFLNGILGTDGLASCGPEMCHEAPSSICFLAVLKNSALSYINDPTKDAIIASIIVSSLIDERGACRPPSLNLAEPAYRCWMRWSMKSCVADFTYSVLLCCYRP